MYNYYNTIPRIVYKMLLDLNQKFKYSTKDRIEEPEEEPKKEKPPKKKEKPKDDSALPEKVE